MNEFPGVDPRPQWLIDHQAEGAKLGMISVDGASYPYTLIKPGSLHPHLPYAVGFEHPLELYISANVPPLDRAHILTHEVREKTSLPLISEEERCKTALAAELSEVQLTRRAHEFKNYVKRRRVYFNDLFTFYQKPQHRAGVSAAFFEGLLLTNSYINHVAGGLKRK